MKTTTEKLKASWTIWLNIIPTILLVIDLLTQEAWIPIKWIPVLFIISSSLNIILRVYKTNSAILASPKVTDQ